MRKKVLMFQGEFDKLRIMDVIDDPFFSYPKSYSQDLKCLLTDVFGIGSATEPQGMSEVSQDGYSYYLVQALAGAALKSWVFESNFETHHFAQTELHVRFCDNLKLICDPSKVFTLDRAYHMSIIRDPVFSREGVEGTVVQLGKRFAEAFRPIIKTVMLRAEMLVDENDYELLWPKAGSPFSRDEMETSRDICNSASAIVRLPLCPGFKMIPKEKATIRYTGLTVAATGNAGAKCVAKALVC
ncbi:hypothetical protein E8E12_001545 [Didymella heteroderae]|uniref:Uncharacterized protein n=1 Tax=Didymella heteroderae TaxID=1769908 RepID=A0A9P4WFY2_9PLEO|nr:hypothetical protein E8E12_001545 [Didymella heteroderae]